MRISLPLYLKGLFLGLIVVSGIFIFAQSAQALTCSWEECQDVWVPGYTDNRCNWVSGYTDNYCNWVPGYTDNYCNWVSGYTDNYCNWVPSQCEGKWVYFAWLDEWVWDSCYYYTPGYWESCYIPGYWESCYIPGYWESCYIPGYWESCWVPGYYETQCTTQYETCSSDWTNDECSSVACQSYYYSIWYTCYSGGGCKFNSTGYYYNDDSCTSLCASGQCSGGSCCNPNWSCTSWSPSPTSISCGVSFTQTRTCTDLNNCGTTAGKPDESRGATGTSCPSGWTCSGDWAVLYSGACISGSCEIIITVDCNANNGWYSSGVCTEEYRNYTCTGAGSCSSYAVTNTRNKANGTACPGGTCSNGVCCECTSGPCCGGCYFKSSGSQPTGWTDTYTCEGTNGAAAESWITFFNWYCNGTDTSVHVSESRIDTCGTCEYCLNNETSCRYYSAGTSCGTNMGCDGSGNCVSICECTSGPCCDGCNYKTLDAQPTGWEDVYRCGGTNGATAESWITFYDWYCNGTDISVHVKELRIDTCGTCEYCLNNETSCRYYAAGTSCGTNIGCDGSGNCVSICECTSGPCCDGCYYKPLDAQPAGWEDVYLCGGTNGATAESWITFFDWYCNGTDIYVHIKEEIKDTCGTCEYCANNEETCRNYAEGTLCGTNMVCNGSGNCVSYEGIYNTSGCTGECNIEGFRAGACVSKFIVPPKTCSDIGYTSCALPAGPEAGCQSNDHCCCVDDISLSLFSSSGSIKQGESTLTTVNVNLGYSGKDVSLSASPPDPTITISFSPATTNPGNSSVMNIDTTSQTPIGTYQITVNGRYDRYIGYNWKDILGNPIPPDFWETVTKTTTYTLEVTEADATPPTVTITTNPLPKIVGTNRWFKDSFTANFEFRDSGGSGLAICQHRVTCGTADTGWVSVSCSGDGPVPANKYIEVGSGKWCSAQRYDACKIYAHVEDGAGNSPTNLEETYGIDYEAPTTE